MTLTADTWPAKHHDPNRKAHTAEIIDLVSPEIKQPPRKRRRLNADINCVEQKKAYTTKPLSLSNLRNLFAPIIPVERLQVKEILVTTTSEGMKEILYYSLKSGTNKYEDWRLQTIKPLSSSSSYIRKIFGDVNGEDQSLKRKKTDKRKLTASDNDHGNKSNNNENNNNCQAVSLTLPRSHCHLFKVDYAVDDLHSLMNVLTGGKMTNNVLDAYLMLVLDNYYHSYNQFDAAPTPTHRPIKYGLRARPTPASQSPEFTDFQYLSVNFNPIWKRDQCLESLSPNMDFFPDFVNDEQHRKNCVLIAPQHADKHFYLAVFYFRKRLIQVHDSSWHYLPMELRTAQLETILKTLTSKWKKWRIDFVKKSAPQLDEYSCGVFTIFYAENLVNSLPASRNCRSLSKSRLGKVREEICRKLLTTTENGRKFLRAISK